MGLDLETLPRDVMRALGFLTRLPVPAKWFEGDDGTLTTTARAFPLAGALLSVPAAIMLAAGTLLDLPPLLSATLAVAVLVMTGGGLHEDGLADVADGLFGSGDRARRLEIMKDSRIGAFGAMALVLALLLRIITLAALLRFGLLNAVFALIAAQAFARTAMIWHWRNLPPAKSEGLAAASGQPGKEAANFAFITGTIVAVLAALLARGWFATGLAVILATGATLAFRKLCLDKINGHTGDTLGAAALVCELGLLTGLVSGL